MSLQDLLPPEALAALTEPCQTCDGQGRYNSTGRGSDGYDECPDCANRVVYVNAGRAAVGYDHLENAYVNGVRVPSLDHVGAESSRVRWVAPPEWVKLAEATCETCDDLPDWQQDICPDCHEGKPIHVVSVPCEWCAGDGWLMGEPDHYERGTDAWLQCECNPNGDDPFVSPGVEVKVVVLELLPVVDADTPPNPDDDASGREVMHSASTGAIWLEVGNYSDRWHPITVVGKPLEPGHHITVIKVLP